MDNIFKLLLRDKILMKNKMRNIFLFLNQYFGK